MPYASTREELRHWAKEVWEKITGHKEEEEVTIKGWVARNEDGTIEVYQSRFPPKDLKPIKLEKYWLGVHINFLLDNSFRQSVQWSDEEPTPCEITIKIKK